MLLTRSKSGGTATATATKVDDLKKKASAAAVAKAVEVIKNGGTQAEATAAAKLVARDILAKGQQQMMNKSSPASPRTKKERKGFMGKIRKNKNKTATKKQQLNSAAKPVQRPPARAFPPEPESFATSDNDSRTGSNSYSSGSASTFSSSSGRASEQSSRAGDSKPAAFTATSKSSKNSQSSKPSIYVDKKDKDNMSLISDENASASTIPVTDLLNMTGVMNAIDKALEEQDAKSEMKKYWMDSLLDCDMCFLLDDDWQTITSGDPSIFSKDADASTQKDPVPVSTPRSAFLKKTEGEGQPGVQVKPSVSWVEDGSITTGATPRGVIQDTSTTDLSTADASLSDVLGAPPKQARASSPQPVDDGAKSPAAVSSKDSSKTMPKVNDPARASTQFFGKDFAPSFFGKGFGPSTSNKQKSKPKVVTEQQQPVVIEKRQDSNLDWRSMVTDEAPNPNANRARNRAPVYDPQRSNPSVFIPPTSQPPRGEVVNFFGASQHGSPMNAQGYGYQAGPQHQHGQQYYPNNYPSFPCGNDPSSPYGANPPPPFPSAGLHGAYLSLQSLDESESQHQRTRVDRYGGVEEVMISEAATMAKTKLDAAANFVYRVQSGDKGDDSTINTEEGGAPERYQGQENNQYNPYGGPPPPQNMPYYPPQQYQGQYPPQQQQQQQQQYPPPPQNFPPQQQQYHPQQQYPPQQNYQQDYPRIDPNPSSAAYYNQAHVSSPMNEQRFAA